MSLAAIAGWIGFWLAGLAALVGLWLVLCELHDWREACRERRARARLVAIGERERRQERAAAAAVSRPHGRRVVVELAEERARRRASCAEGARQPGG